MTTPITPDCFEERLLEQLTRIVAANPEHEDETFEPAARRVRHPLGRPPRLRDLRWVGARRPLSARSWACAVVVAVAAVVGLVIVASLGGSQSGIAQAAVLTRATAALSSSDELLYVQEQVYGGARTCTLGGSPSSMGPASLCVGSTSDDAGLSADPSHDPLDYSAQEWLSGDHTQTHTIYSNGNETAGNTTSQLYEAYDAADNTLTTLTDWANPSPPANTIGAETSLFFALPGGFDPDYYTQLYQDAQAGQDTSGGNATLTAQLIGQTTIADDPVYELAFTLQLSPPANPPAGDTCGSAVCPAFDRQVLVYLDTQTYMPVRTVISYPNRGGQAGMIVATVVDYTVQSLPDTQASENLLEMNTHPAATQINETEAQYNANANANAEAQVGSVHARNGIRRAREGAGARHR